MSTRSFHIPLTRIDLPAKEPKINRLTRSQSTKLTAEERSLKFISLETINTPKTKNCDDQLSMKSQFVTKIKDEGKKQSKRSKKKDDIPSTNVQLGPKCKKKDDIKSKNVSLRCKNKTIQKSESSHTGIDKQEKTKDARSNENVEIATTTKDEEKCINIPRGRNDDVNDKENIHANSQLMRSKEEEIQMIDVEAAKGNIQ